MCIGDRPDLAVQPDREMTLIAPVGNSGRRDAENFRCLSGAAEGFHVCVNISHALNIHTA